MNIQSKTIPQQQLNSIESYSVHDRLRFKARNDLLPLYTDERAELERRFQEIDEIGLDVGQVTDEDLLHLYCDKRDL